MDNIEYNNLPDKKRRLNGPFFYVLSVIILVGGIFIFKSGGTFNFQNGGLVSHANEETVYEKFEKNNPMPAKEINRLDVLILGIRGEDDLKNGGLLTDSMEIISLDKITGAVSTIAIPRDLFVQIGGYSGKINGLYEHGLSKGQGLKFVEESISRITGVYIDKALVIDFNAFHDIVEDLGGIDVHLDKPFSEKSQWGYEFALPEGDNHLNGEQALYYVRSRYSSNDFDRAARQQQVMLAIKQKATSLGFLANPVKVTSLLSSLGKNVKTDFQLWNAGDLISLANSFGSSKVKHYVISLENLLNYRTAEKYGYILFAKEGENNFDKFKDLFKNILSQ